MYAPAWLILVVFFFSALSLFWGARLVHENKCFEVGNSDISTMIPEITVIAEKVLITSTFKTKFNFGRYFSLTERVIDYRFSLHNTRLSIWEWIIRIFSVCSAHMQLSTADNTFSLVAFIPFERKVDISVSFSEALESRCFMIFVEVLPKTSESKSSNAMLEIVRRFYIRFFSPVMNW